MRGSYFHIQFVLMIRILHNINVKNTQEHFFQFIGTKFCNKTWDPVIDLKENGSSEVIMKLPCY